MAVAVADLIKRVGATQAEAQDLQKCLTVTGDLLDRYVASLDVADPVPDSVLDEARLACAAELFHQRRAPNGVLNQQFATAEGGVTVPVRIGADPLRPAYPLLGMWVDPVTFA